MTSSELRYLITLNELCQKLEIVKQTDIAKMLNVTKVSTYNALERLREKGFIEKGEKKIVVSQLGKEVLKEYMTIIGFISSHLELHCGTTKKTAYEDAINATCAFSDTTRNGVAKFIQQEMKGMPNEQRI